MKKLLLYLTLCSTTYIHNAEVQQNNNALEKPAIVDITQEVRSPRRTCRTRCCSIFDCCPWLERIAQQLIATK